MRNVLNQLQRWVLLGAASAGVLISLPVLAQTAPSPEAPEATESTAEPATPDTEFTPEELERFANIIPELQTLQEAAQAEVITAVEGSGLTAERFNEIANAQASPEETDAVEVSSEEEAAFEAATSEIEQIETDFLTQRESLLQSEGLTVERYRELLAAVQNDPALLQQIEAML